VPDVAQGAGIPEPASLAGALKASPANRIGEPDRCAAPCSDCGPGECTECGATGTPLDGGRCHNLDLCADRQAAKASTTS
jgi:hypothetical protein